MECYRDYDTIYANGKREKKKKKYNHYSMKNLIS